MRIEKLVIKGLHGYIDKTISFNEDLTLLVGINGSGKTSILNIINWLLQPSIPVLCVTEFNSITLKLHFDLVAYEIVCKHNKLNLTYTIKTAEEQFSPLTVRIITPPSVIKNDYSLKLSLIEQYKTLRPETKEKKTWDLISTFPNPTVIGLDRFLYAKESEKDFFQEDIRGKIFKSNSIGNTQPLDRVKEIVNTEYRKKKNSILNLTSDLKNELMLSAFTGNITFDSFKKGFGHKLDLDEIENVENRVKGYFKKLDQKSLNDGEQKIISKYFSQLKNIGIQYQNKPGDEKVMLLYGLNVSQFMKVNQLLKKFEKFENDSDHALKQITNYIDTLNFFFKDSAKKLLFKEDTAELSFHTLDKQGNIITEFKDIKFLSSGEQQILILFSYVAFNSQDGKLFIIDEPELSLHIKWQEEFLNQLEKITPNGTQLILATHSPILANKKKEKAKVLLPYN